MVCLGKITDRNWVAAASIELNTEQQSYVASPIGIIARGYIYRNFRAKVFTVENDGKIIGLAMIREMHDEPVGYELQQLMIDRKYQNFGFGREALRAVLAYLRSDGRYTTVEVCVNKNNEPAIHLYESEGFSDTGYIDESIPDALNLVCRLV